MFAKSLIYTAEGGSESINENNFNIIRKAQNGTLYCAFDIYISGARDLVLATSTDNGITWITEKNFISDDYLINQSYGVKSIRSPQVLVDSNNDIYIIFFAKNLVNSNFYLYSKKKSGGAWQEAKQITRTINAEFSAELDSNDNIHLIQSLPNTVVPSNDCYYFFYNGTWSAGTGIGYSGYSLGSTYARISIDTEGNVHATWRQMTPSNPTTRCVLYRKKTGATWGAIETISSNATANNNTIYTHTNNDVYVSNVIDYGDKLQINIYNNGTSSWLSTITLSPDGDIFGAGGYGGRIISDSRGNTYLLCIPYNSEYESIPSYYPISNYMLGDRVEMQADGFDFDDLYSAFAVLEGNYPKSGGLPVSIMPNYFSFCAEASGVESLFFVYPKTTKIIKAKPIYFK